ncbi:MAG: polysialyltransferase family glycosyltransferase [Eggerthellaceae bacterium]|jgi:hypothetical protein
MGNTESECTIFVATRVGQVRNEINYIRTFRPVHPRSLLLTPVRDRQLRTNLVSMVESDDFDRYTVTILPNYPASARTVLRRPKVYRAMLEGTREIVGEATKVTLFLHHANRYYAYFDRIFAELGITDYSLNMLEEGLATYKWGCPGLEDIDTEARQYTPAESLHRMGHELAKACRNLIRIIGHLVKFVLRFLELIVAILSVITRKNLFESIVNGIVHLTPRKYRFGIVPHFDNGFFCFPDKMRSVQAFEIDALHQLPFETSPAHREQEILSSVDVVFASQKYGDPSVYYEIVLQIFEEMGLSRVFFKLHPRENLRDVIEFLDAAMRNHPDVQVVHDAELDAIPLETLLTEGSCTEVVGITTSTLMYLPLINPAIKPVSIADRFFELYCACDPSGAEGQGLSMRTFRGDLATFHAVAPEVEQFHLGREPSGPLMEDAVFHSSESRDQ